MEYINIAEAAKKWGISERRIQDWCKQGLIPGADKWGRAWRIPLDAKRPSDNRRKDVKKEEAELILPVRTPMLVFSNLYSTSGMVQECIASLKGYPGAALIFEAQMDYIRGNIDKAYEKMCRVREEYSGFYVNISVGTMLAVCGMYRGDIELWINSVGLIKSTPYRNEAERELKELALAVLGSSLYLLNEYPEWLINGEFANLYADAYPYASFAYTKYYFILAGNLAMQGMEKKAGDGLALMTFLPRIVEPMISHARVEKQLVNEIYLRLICASAYHDTGHNDKAIVHIDKAIALALPDKLYGPLAEQRKPLDYLLDERLALVDTEALRCVKELNKKLIYGWVKVNNAISGKRTATNLTRRETEAAKLATFGLTNQQISARLHISVSAVKQALRLAMDKTGAQTRSELAAYL